MTAGRGGGGRPAAVERSGPAPGSENRRAPLARPAQAIAAGRIRILTLNMHKGFNGFNRKFVLHELRDAVRSADAHIVFLQEVVGAHEDHSVRYERWPAAPQYEFLAEQIWGNFAYGRNAVYQEGHHGNALLSQFPIVRHSNRDVSVHGHEKRGLLHSVVQLPPDGRELHTLCVHLGLRESHRRQQVDLLRRLIEVELPPSAPLVIAGDFNDWRLRSHDRLLREAGLSEAFSGDGSAPARTFPALWPLLRLDRLYYRNLALREARVLSHRPWSHLSDHAALLAVVDA
jgi:endonuclease/exonuclease/phosphatase family metal-dependent hydrolase